MKIILAGGRGQIGTMLSRAFWRDGHNVVVLSRTPNVKESDMVPWDACTFGSWTNELDGAWEQAVMDAGNLPHTRIILLRSAMTMSPNRGGVFDVLSGLVRRGLGGSAGSGRQYVSWIHEFDFVRAIYWLIEQEGISGVVNLSSPKPVPDAEFMKSLR